MFTHKQAEIFKIAIVSIPTAGHIKILLRMAAELKLQYENVRFSFVLTSWQGFKINSIDENKLKKLSNNRLFIFTASGKIAPMDIFSRAEEITDQVIEKCRDHHQIIYDFMAPEGYIAARQLNTPVISSNPAFVGPFNPDSKEFNTYLERSKEVIKRLENRYDVNLFNHIQLISGTLTVQAAKNIIFSWKQLICTSNFSKNREQYEYLFMRPSYKNNQLDKDEFAYLYKAKEEGKKIIYFSLGTIAPAGAWDFGPDNLRLFIKNLYQQLLAIAYRREDLIFIIATGRKAEDLFDPTKISTNVFLYETAPQIKLLPKVDLFITHCGGNGVNEAIDYEVPMIGIPLMFDQHECAERISELGIGISFQLQLEQRVKAVDLSAGIYFRDINETQFEAAMNSILSKPDYKMNIKLIKKETLYFDKLMSILYSLSTTYKERNAEITQTL